LGEWKFSKDELKKPSETFNHYWNETNNELILGDFNSLVTFLVTNSGKKEAIESLIK
jgi:hypothetical protein